MDANGPNVVEHTHPTVSRASFEGWPLRWKVAAIMVLPVLLAVTFGALRILPRSGFVAGNAGMHLGAYMSGGTIDVSGNGSDWVGAAMSGRELRFTFACRY